MASAKKSKTGSLFLASSSTGQKRFMIYLTHAKRLPFGRPPFVFSSLRHCKKTTICLLESSSLNENHHLSSRVFVAERKPPFVFSSLRRWKKALSAQIYNITRRNKQINITNIKLKVNKPYWECLLCFVLRLLTTVTA